MMRDQLLEVVSRLDRCTIAVDVRVLFSGHANLKDLAIRSGSSARNMSSRLCDGRRMTAMMPRRSAQLHASLTFSSFRRRRSNNRIFRLFTERASGWSTTGLRSQPDQGAITRSWVRDSEEHYAKATPGSRDLCRYDE